VERRRVSWVQWFDGKGWNNQYGRLYGIRGIPTMWFPDHNGRIAERETRGPRLGAAVERLLAARPKP